eukprot:TRINITY_DN87552_c0_g1_i1.p1 TRINITY_DN87552_c0_g1~~TRINITY_DN87552_c0_g1_i1.p1  ORF type:complete len:566 (-),score=86.44 TRINITY_DN87552_c0_g1_i1:234-1931(-)
MPTEKRTDPADGQVYTYKQLLDWYANKYSQVEIDSYWWNECSPVASCEPKPGMAETSKGDAEAEAKMAAAERKKKKKKEWVINLRNKFAWCSLDPVSKKLVPYPLKQSMLLEAAFLQGQSEVTIMVQPTAMDHGLIATVRFNDPTSGEHTQCTMSGSGQRKVRRAYETVQVDFGDEGEFDLPRNMFASFGRMAWVSVEPVQGVLQPYSRENALLIEHAYHLKKPRVVVTVIIPSGVELRVTVNFDFAHGKHTQSTGSGLRSVSRIVNDSVPSEGIDLPLYRRPDDGSIDALRYRLEASERYCEEPLERVGTLNVPESVFMEESTLGVDAFSSVKLMEVALSEMGYQTDDLNAVADCMKEEPMRLAANTCLREYKDNNEVTLLKLIDEIIADWVEGGIVTKPKPSFDVLAPGSAECCGSFQAVAEHNGKLKFKGRMKEAFIYFDECWKLNNSDATDSWCYSMPGSTSELPPEGEWPRNASGSTPEPDSANAKPAVVHECPYTDSSVKTIADYSVDFPQITAALFVSWDADSETLRGLLSSMRGGGKILMLAKVAAAGLWRTVMQGA